jgi:hypothetical protein
VPRHSHREASKMKDRHFNLGLISKYGNKFNKWKFK